MSRLRVLLVEDDQELAEMMSDLLFDEGYTAERAATGEEALERFAGSRPDVVITDNTLTRAHSGLTGLQFAQLARVLSPDTPIVMVSGVPPHEAGRVCNLVLTKPIDFQTLLEVVRHLTGSPEAASGCAMAG